MSPKIIEKIKIFFKDLMGNKSEDIIIKKNQEIDRRVEKIKECIDDVIDQKFVLEKETKELIEKSSKIVPKMENAAKANQEEYARKLISDQFDLDDQMILLKNSTEVLKKYEKDLECYVHWLKKRKDELNHRFHQTRGKFNPESEVSLQEMKFREKYYRIKKYLIKNQFNKKNQMNNHQGSSEDLSVNNG